MHLKAYLIQVSIHTQDEWFFCKLFSTTLDGTTLNWYYLLSTYSVHSFEALSTVFRAWFKDCKAVPTLSATLGKQDPRTFDWEVHHENDNDLKPYSIGDHALINLWSTAWPEPFSNSLFTKKLNNMDNLRKQVTKYMAIEENKLKGQRSPPCHWLSYKPI